MPLERSLLGNASIVLSGQVAFTLFNFLSLVLVARSLNLADFGLFVLAQTYITIYGLIISFQTWQPVSKYGADLLARNRLSDLERLFSAAFLVDVFSALIFSLVGLGLIEMASAYLGWQDEQRGLLIVFLGLVLFNISSGLSGIIRLNEQYQIIAHTLAWTSGLRLLLVFVVSLSSSSLVHFAIAWVLAEAFQHLILVLKAKKSWYKRFGFPLRIRPGFFPEQWAFLRFLITNNFDVSVRLVSRHLDIVLLGFLAGRESVALYKIAVQLCSIPARLVDPLYQVLLPRFSSMHSRGEFEKSRHLVIRISLAGIAFFLVAYLCAWLLGEPLIAFFFSDTYLPAYPIMMIYLLAVAGAIVGVPFVPYFQSLGEVGRCLRMQVVATVVYLLVLYPLILWAAEAGAAVAYIVYYATWMMLAVSYFLTRSRAN